MDLHLAPRPQKLRYHDETHALQSDRFILLQTQPDVLRFSGERLQAALAELGIGWELTAAAGDDPEQIGAVFHVDPAQVPRQESYTLTITPQQIRIFGHDPAGVFYGVCTLIQLLRQLPAERTLPCLRIEDWPDFPARGVMLDISRDKVPTMETLYQLVDLLASWKVNQVQLYTEHTFAYRNHREVWANASPMTGEEVLALDAYCRERFVELVPNQNSFGHMERWLVHDHYKPLAEAPDGWTTPWGQFRDYPFSLCPGDPRSLELLRELFAELLPHFTSTQFNVGCDETWDVGQGRSKEAVARHSAGRVYLDFLLQIYQLVREHDRTMQFWGDIVTEHPELIPELPPHSIALEWGYEADHPFDSNVARYAEAGVPFYVCPGTSSWVSIAGRTDNAVGNLLNAAANGFAHGAIGCLNTDWGDLGHWQYLPVSYLGFVYGAALSWAVEPNRDLDLSVVLDQHAFRDQAGVMGRLAYDLGNAYKETGVTPHNSSVLVWLLLLADQPLSYGRAQGVTVEGLRRALEYIDGVMESLGRAEMQRADASLIQDEFRNAAAMMRHACRMGVARFEAGGEGSTADLNAEVRRTLAADIETVVQEHRRLWLARNRPGGLDDSARRLERVLELYKP